MATDPEHDPNVYMAKLAEQAERYEEMVDYMKKVATGVRENSDLTLEERNLLSVAYKNVVGARRASLRIITSIEQREQAKDSANVTQIAAYKYKVEEELKNICADILKLLKDSLIKPSLSSEPNVFYCKMQADYHRYLAEFATNNEKTENAEHASASYKTAMDIAEKELASTHPIRLGLALNYSVFLYEVNNQQDTACSLAKSAFDAAIAELDKLDEESYKDSTLIMQLLRDNLTLWTSDDQNE